MNMESYKHLAESFKKSFAPIAEMQLELTRTSFESLKEVTDDLAHILASCYSIDYLNDSLSYLSSLCKDLALILTDINLPVIPNYALDFINKLDIQNEYVELSEDDCHSINTLLTSTNIESPAETTPQNKIPTMQFIITILIPIIFGILQLWQNEVHYRQDSINADNANVQEQEYLEQMAQTLTEIQDFLNNLQESQESCPCNCSDVPTLQDEAPIDRSGVQSHIDSVERHMSYN